jgi:hypothetical protein
MIRYSVDIWSIGYLLLLAALLFAYEIIPSVVQRKRLYDGRWKDRKMKVRKYLLYLWGGKEGYENKSLLDTDNRTRKDLLLCRYHSTFEERWIGSLHIRFTPLLLCIELGLFCDLPCVMYSLS